MNSPLKLTALWGMGIFLFLCPFKDGVKSLRVGGLVLAAAILCWAWWKWRVVGITERERLDAADDHRNSPLVWNPFLLPILLILGVTLASAVFSLAPEFSLKEIRKQLVLYVFVFFTLWNVVRWTGLRGLWWLIWSLVLGGAVSAMIGVWGYYFGRMVEVGRATGTLDSYTRSAMFFAMQLPLTLVLIMEQLRRKEWLRIVALIVVMGLGLWFVLLTQTRGVWVSVAITFGLIAVFSGRWILVGVLLASAAGVFFLSPSLQARLGTFVEHWGEWEQLSSGRIEIWNHGWEAIQAHPWLGVGYGPDIFQEESVRAHHVIDNYTKQPDLHQFYLQQLAEVGLLGIVAYIIFAMTLMLHSLRRLGRRLWVARRKSNDEARSLGLAVLGIWGALASILIYGMIGNFYENHNAYVFWSVIALAAGAPMLRISSDVSANGDSRSSSRETSSPSS